MQKLPNVLPSIFDEYVYVFFDQDRNKYDFSEKNFDWIDKHEKRLAENEQFFTVCDSASVYFLGEMEQSVVAYIAYTEINGDVTLESLGDEIKESLRVYAWFKDSIDILNGIVLGGETTQKTKGMEISAVTQKNLELTFANIQSAIQTHIQQGGIIEIEISDVIKELVEYNRRLLKNITNTKSKNPNNDSPLYFDWSSGVLKYNGKISNPFSANQSLLLTALYDSDGIIQPENDEFGVSPIKVIIAKINKQCEQTIGIRPLESKDGKAFIKEKYRK